MNMFEVCKAFLNQDVDVMANSLCYSGTVKEVYDIGNVVKLENRATKKLYFISISHICAVTAKMIVNNSNEIIVNDQGEALL